MDVIFKWTILKFEIIETREREREREHCVEQTGEKKIILQQLIIVCPIKNLDGVSAYRWRLYKIKNNVVMFVQLMFWKIKLKQI